MVQALCRNCGQHAKAEEFKLHYLFGQMVCAKCFRKGPEDKKNDQAQPQVEVIKPPGWDKEDEYLEKIARQKKQESRSQFTRIPGSHQVQCKCAKCKYQFKYDPFKKKPRTCPYCDMEIPKLNTMHLL